MLKCIISIVTRITIETIILSYFKIDKNTENFIGNFGCYGRAEIRGRIIGARHVKHQNRKKLLFVFPESVTHVMLLAPIVFGARRIIAR